MTSAYTRLCLFLCFLLPVIQTNSVQASEFDKTNKKQIVGRDGPYIQTEQDPYWRRADDQWLGGIIGDGLATGPVFGSSDAADSFYPWGYTAHSYRRGRYCVTNQLATNGLETVILYQKVRPKIYCDPR